MAGGARGRVEDGDDGAATVARGWFDRPGDVNGAASDWDDRLWGPSGVPGLRPLGAALRRRRRTPRPLPAPDQDEDALDDDVDDGPPDDDLDGDDLDGDDLDGDDLDGDDLDDVAEHVPCHEGDEQAAEQADGGEHGHDDASTVDLEGVLASLRQVLTHPDAASVLTLTSRYRVEGAVQVLESLTEGTPWPRWAVAIEDQDGPTGAFPGDVVERILELRGKGLDNAAIAKVLEQLGVPAVRGERWTGGGVKWVLLSERRARASAHRPRRPSSRR